MLTVDDIALVRASFAKVLPIKDAAADLFYDRLFEIAPQLRPMFPGGSQGAKAQADGDDRRRRRRTRRSRRARSDRSKRSERATPVTA